MKLDRNALLEAQPPRQGVTQLAERLTECCCCCNEVGQALVLAVLGPNSRHLRQQLSRGMHQHCNGLEVMQACT